MIKKFGRFVFITGGDGFGIIFDDPYFLLALGFSWSILHLLPSITLERGKTWEVGAGFLMFSVSIRFRNLTKSL